MRILIVKVGALGDVVRTSFIAQGLKEKYKHAEITWLTSPQATTLFLNNPYVKKVIADTSEERDKLLVEKFDLVINLEEERTYAEFVDAFKAEKIGFILKEGKIAPTPTAKEWFDMSLLGEKPGNDILKRECKKTHRQIMAEIVGINDKKYEPFLRLNKDQFKMSQDFKKRYNLKPHEMVVGLVLGGADRWPKQLPVKLSAKLIDMLYKRFKCRMILFGGPSEEERNKEIIARATSPIIDAGTGNDLTEFPALLNVCNYVIATDSMGLHVALALKKKVVCLIGPTPPHEKDMYGLGTKVIAKSNCIACLKRDCKSMEKINLAQVVSSLERLTKKSVALVITTFKEPKIKRAIQAALHQNLKQPYKIIIAAPDEETQRIAQAYQKKYKIVSFFKDPGKGKNYALNLLLFQLKEDILVFTDGDVYLHENALQEILHLFNDSGIGCVSGRPVPEESHQSMYGYWASFLFEQAHLMRKRAFSNHDFLECSGYLFAIRNGVVDSFPLDSPEDTIIPYFFWEKGYRIGYAENAQVFVKNVDNWRDWISQKVRTSRSHEVLSRYVDVATTPRQKTFLNEAKGATDLLLYAKNMKELLWSLSLLSARGYMWANVFWSVKARGQSHTDAWERVESTK